MNLSQFNFIIETRNAGTYLNVWEAINIKQIANVKDVREVAGVEESPHVEEVIHISNFEHGINGGRLEKKHSEKKQER